MKERIISAISLLCACALICVCLNSCYTYRSAPEKKPETLKQSLLQDTETVDSTMTMKAAKVSTERTLPRPRKVKALAGYNSIMIRWKRVSQADAYIVDVVRKGKWKRMGITRRNKLEMKKAKQKSIS